VADELADWSDEEYQDDFDAYRNCRKVYSKKKAKKHVEISQILPIGARPICLKWNDKIVKGVDGTWPPRNCVLGDRELYKVLDSDITTRQRQEYYPEDFDTNGKV